jgi:hypothetical protein
MNPIIYILIGLITGISIGVVGIGAGVLLMPLLISSGVSIHTAVSVGLALQLVPQSLPGLWLYNNKGHFDWKLSLYIILGSFVGTTIGAYLVNYEYIDEKLMYKLLFIIMFMCTAYIGIYHI